MVKFAVTRGGCPRGEVSSALGLPQFQYTLFGRKQTNNRGHPYIEMTKTYDNTQRVKVRRKCLNLEEAVGHNVEIM